LKSDNIIQYGRRSRPFLRYAIPQQLTFLYSNGCLVDSNELFIKQRQPRVRNLCVFNSVILRLELLASSLDQVKYSKGADYYQQKTSSLLNIPMHTDFSEGISLREVTVLERSLHPISAPILRTYPDLRLYKGIAINIFRIDYNNRIYKLFARKLSIKYKSPSYLQVDLLECPIGSSQSGETCCPSSSKTPTSFKHVLLIPNLAKLLRAYKQKFSTDYLLKKLQKQKFVCRACFR
jgi:hypothetical protein